MLGILASTILTFTGTLGSLDDVVGSYGGSRLSLEPGQLPMPSVFADDDPLDDDDDGDANTAEELACNCDPLPIVNVPTSTFALQLNHSRQALAFHLRI